MRQSTVCTFNVFTAHHDAAGAATQHESTGRSCAHRHTHRHTHRRHHAAPRVLACRTCGGSRGSGTGRGRSCWQPLPPASRGARRSQWTVAPSCRRAAQTRSMSHQCTCDARHRRQAGNRTVDKRHVRHPVCPDKHQPRVPFVPARVDSRSHGPQALRQQACSHATYTCFTAPTLRHVGTCGDGRGGGGGGGERTATRVSHVKRAHSATPCTLSHNTPRLLQ